MSVYGITSIGEQRYFPRLGLEIDAERTKDYDLLWIDPQKTTILKDTHRMHQSGDVTPRYEQYDSEVTRVHDIDELLRLLEVERARRTITDAGSNES